MGRKRLMKAWRTFQGYSTRKKIAVIGGISAALLILIPVGTYAYFVRDISDRERLMNRNNTGIILKDHHGETFYSYGRIGNQNDVTLGQINDSVEKAAIASEDKDFYKHPGLSLRGIAAALYANLWNRDLTRYGGSTITQQLVKNNLLSSGKNFLRKYQEVSIAVAVDRRYSKDEILEMYLNSVYFGEGAFGIGPAARTYFNKTPNQLTLGESSLLIGILPAPSAYSPISGDLSKAQVHQKRVLDHMIQAGFITAEQRDAALTEKLAFNTGPAAVNQYAHHFTQMVIADLNKRYGEERVTRSGFTVTTSLDLKWQKLAEQQVQTRVRQLSSQGGKNSALVAIDPRNGEIRALVGSTNWDDPTFGKVNMATSPRQPGSSFKPIYYAEAMDERIITPATILHDTAKTYGTYKPLNYDFRFMGDIPVRRALALSRNLTAVEVMQKLGVEEASSTAQRMGINTVNEPQKYGLSLALGTAETRLLDMTNAYAAFAHEGKQFPPVSIVSIKDKFGKEVYKDKTKDKRVQSAEASFLVSSILSDTQARAPTFNSLNIAGRQVAVKTGTTNDNKDAWTIGYTPSISVGVWVGNNENKAMSGVAGASGAGPVWRNTIQGILAGTRTETFKQPSGVEKIAICSGSGFRAEREGPGTYNEFFIRGTAPSQTCNAAPPPLPPQQEEEEEEEEDDENPPPISLRQCADGKDNDGDGRIDFPADRGCRNIRDNDESDDPELRACNDNVDNDNDGLIDLDDPGCEDEEDNSESGGSGTGTGPINSGFSLVPFWLFYRLL